MKHKFLLFVLGVIIIAILSYSWAIHQFSKEVKNSAQSKRVKVVVSFYPLYYFTREIGGVNVDVINLTPAGAEPHDYEPNTQDVVKIEESNLLIIIGGGFEPWFSKTVDDLKQRNVKFLTLSDGLAYRKGDLHIWLDPVLAEQIIGRIVNSLSQIDKTNKIFYEANGRRLIKKLKNLDKNFARELSGCKQRKFITSHQAFEYLAHRYNLEQISIAGLSPDDEPSPKELAEIVTIANKNRVRYIFFETLVSSRFSETVAGEIGVKTMVLDPIEGVTISRQKKGENYFTIQKENLNNLRIALECI